jgi:hypothetical protein
VGGDKGGVELLIQTTLPIIAKTRTVNLIKAGDEGVTAYCQAVKPGDNEVFVTWHPVPHELAMAAVQTRTLVIHLTTVAASSADRHTILCDGLNDAGVHAYRWGTNSFTIAPLDSPF